MERAYRESLREMMQLRQDVQGSPDLSKEVGELMRDMQRFDPTKFNGNPELLERMRSEILPGLVNLELALRQSDQAKTAGQVRTSGSEKVPAGYGEAVAEYFRRLSKGK
jgi:hypothetical protein